ncbi:hypothetical protein Glove_198g66 [Diversispora epigaea]|uniref:Uncharacterized protein n=1 Tax=Diversispora epigaea TaxID=1348612 RepID=A0A397IQ79_9GLOM|nr:hypothetical protein Glove_198g66 [Diversispora epigaea]
MKILYPLQFSAQNLQLQLERNQIIQPNWLLIERDKVLKGHDETDNNNRDVNQEVESSKKRKSSE